MSSRKLFIKHRVDRTFSLTILHHHYYLEPDEMLFNYKGTSVPWNTDNVSRTKPPQPAIWAVSPITDQMCLEDQYAQYLTWSNRALRIIEGRYFLEYFTRMVQHKTRLICEGLCQGITESDCSGQMNILFNITVWKAIKTEADLPGFFKIIFFVYCITGITMTLAFYIRGWGIQTMLPDSSTAKLMFGNAF